MADIQGQDEFILRPGSIEVLRIGATPNSAVDAEDGSIPYDTTVDSVEVTAKTAKGEAADDLLNGSASVSNNVISIPLKYPATSGEGLYGLDIVLTLNDGQAIPKKVDKRIIAEDI